MKPAGQQNGPESQSLPQVITPYIPAVIVITRPWYVANMQSVLILLGEHLVRFMLQAHGKGLSYNLYGD